MKEYKKPKGYLIVLITGIVLAAIFVLASTLVGISEPAPAVGSLVLASVAVILLIVSILIFFAPNFRRTGAKYRRYLQNETKDIESDIYSTKAEIRADGIRSMAKATKEGFNATIFCKHCGAKIDSDSKFCKECGKQQ